MKALSIPPDVTSAHKADEIFRGWIVDEQLCCLMRSLTWKEEPETWGIFLADALHHICNAIQDETGQSAEELKELILQVFNSEIATPTDVHEGNFYNE